MTGTILVMRYLDCGRFEAGFGRARCPACHAEFLVATSCKERGMCPSCGAKRAAVFAAFLHDELLDPLDLLARCARGDSPSPAGGRRPPLPHSGSAAPSLRPPRPRQRTAADGEFLARVIAHVPQPRLHTVRYMGHYSNVSRGRRLKGRDSRLDTMPGRDEPDGLSPAERRARRRAWARLLHKVYEVSPLTCPKCGTEMKVISVILDPTVIKKILDHIRRKKATASRAPPDAQGSLAAVS